MSNYKLINDDYMGLYLPTTLEQKSINVSRGSPTRDFDLGLPVFSTRQIKGREYEKSVWVYACIGMWTQIAGIPMQLISDSDNETEVTTGAVPFLLQNPNSKETPFMFWELSIIFLGLEGEYFHLKEDGNKTEGLPKFLTLFPPALVKAKKDDFDRQGIQRTWTLIEPNGERKVPVQGVIHNKLSNPYSRNRGMSPLKAAELTVSGDFAARTHNEVQMKNRGRMEGIAMYDDQTPDQLQDYSRQWAKKYGGPRNAGKVAHVSGMRDFKQMNQTMKDLDWLKGQKLNQEEILAIFGIPPPMVGILDRATYSNYDQAAKSLWTETLIPLAKRITDSIQKELVDPFAPGNTVKFDVLNSVPALAEDKDSKIKQYENLVKNFVSPEMAAIAVNLDIGEIMPEHKQVWIPMNLVPSDAINETPEKAISPEELVDKVMEKMEEKARIQHQRKEAQNRGERLKAMIWRAIISAQEPIEKRFIKMLRTFFFDQRVATLKSLQVWTGTFLKAVIKVDEEPSFSSDGLLDEIFKKAEWDKELIERSKPFLDDAFKTAALQLLAQLGFSDENFSETIMESFRVAQEELIKKVNATTLLKLDLVRETLVMGISEGLPTGQIALQMEKDLKSVFNTRTGNRNTIARTEVSRAFSSGRQAQMANVGADRKMWVSSRDGQERDSHKSGTGVDGEVKVIDELFSNGLMFPHDPRGAAKETVNCRCIHIPILPGEDEEEFLV